MSLFALFTPFLAIGLLDSWFRPAKVYGRMSAWLGGLVWTFAVTIVYWLFRTRDLLGYDFGSLTVSLFTTEYALFWVPVLAGFLFFGRRKEINDSRYAFLYWLGGMMCFQGIRDFAALPASSQAAELFLVPLSRVILLALAVIIYYEWEDSRDLNWKILWGLALPGLWLVFSLVLAWAFLGWTPPAAIIIAGGGAALGYFYYWKRLPRLA